MYHRNSCSTRHMQIACWNFKIPNQQDPVACLSSYDRRYSSKLFAIDMTVDGRNDSFIMFSTRVPPVEKFAMCITMIYRCIDCGWYPAECSWQRERQVEPWGCCCTVQKCGCACYSLSVFIQGRTWAKDVLRFLGKVIHSVMLLFLTIFYLLFLT